MNYEIENLIWQLKELLPHIMLASAVAVVGLTLTFFLIADRKRK